MTLTADLPRTARRPARTAVVPPDRTAVPTRPAGIVTRTDVLRLAGTLATVGAALGVLGPLVPTTGPADGQHALQTPYGVVALGHVSVDAGSTPLRRVTVPVTLHNLSDEPVHYGPEHFRLSTPGTTASPQAGSVRTGRVAAGGAVQLHLVFDVPSATSVRLTVEDARPSTGLRLQLPTPLAAAGS